MARSGVLASRWGYEVPKTSSNGDDDDDAAASVSGDGCVRGA